MSSKFRAVAILCVRNEELHIASALADLIGEGLEVVLIDHESTDRTVQIARGFMGRGLLSIERLEWTGRFSLTQQLEAKAQVIERLDHDWIVHVDADEWLSSPDEGQSLLDGLRAADAAGYNCVHFNEYVFVPRPGENLEGTDFRRAATRYYFFQPRYPFLVRAWKNHAGLENRAFGGHLLSGDAHLYPRDFPMRHYIFLSEGDAERKYLDRLFDDAEIVRGWHWDKLKATKENLRFPSDDRTHELPHWSSKQFDASAPHKEHYWEWAQPAAVARPRRVVFLHAGTHKTGTTAVQQMLGTQYPALGRNGIYVPLPAGDDVYGVLAAHQAAAWEFVLDAEANAPFDALLEDLQRNELPMAVISSENFELLHRKPATLARIASALNASGYEPYVVLYVRPQSTYAESLYAELVKHGLARSFDACLDDLIEAGGATYYGRSYSFEYANLAARFAVAFGADRVIVRPYLAQRPDDFILHDFLAAISAPGQTEVAASARRANERLTFLDVLRRLHRNALNRPRGALGPDALVARTLGDEERDFLNRPFAILDSEDEKRLAARFAENNALLAKQYGVELAPEPERATDAGVSPQKRLMQAAKKRWRLD